MYNSWQKGTENEAEYSTKHFPPAYHRQIRPRYILKAHFMKLLKKFLPGEQGCVEDTRSQSQNPHQKVHIDRRSDPKYHNP